MNNTYRQRRSIGLVVIVIGIIVALISSGSLTFPSAQPQSTTPTVVQTGSSPALDALGILEIKGRAPKTDYSREQFGNGWTMTAGCDTRNIILHRDLVDTVVDASCVVTKGVLNDPYTGKTIQFVRGSGTSADVQIDHVVALSNAWQTGAQLLSEDERIQLANDPLELLAVDGPANQQKSDGDAATWLPSNKPFRCQYVARQVAIKQKYHLWVTSAERDVIKSLLESCPNQPLPTQ